MNRFVTVTIIATVRDEADADEIVRCVSVLGEALAATGHHAGVRVDYTDGAPAAQARVASSGAN